MKGNNQQGFVTLLITSVLLLCALIVTLGSYRSVFHQIKVAQNEVEGRKDHWKAEGGLECGFGYIVDTSSTEIPSTLNSLCDDTVTSLQKSPLDQNILVATENKTKINKEISFYNDSGLGAIQALSALEIISENIMDIDPEVSSTGVDGVYECVAVRFYESVTHTKYAGGTLTTVPPSGSSSTPSDFQSCKGVLTNLEDNAIITKNGSTGTSPTDKFQDDYVYDPDMSGFLNYFGLEKTPANINHLKNTEYEVINMLEVDSNGSMTHVDLDATGNKYQGKECSTRINSAFSSGKDKVWVVGDCVIWYPGINIVDGSGVITPRSLVIENGIFANGNASVFDGAFYHLNDMSIYHDTLGAPNNTDLLASSWSKMPATMNYSSLVKSNSVYIANASFYPKGGIFFDSLGGLSTIKGSMNLDYVGEYNPHDEPVNIKWKKGSWNDL